MTTSSCRPRRRAPKFSHEFSGDGGSWMMLRSNPGLRGRWTVLVLTVVALQSCTAETEGPQPGQQPSTTVQAPSTVAASPPPAAPTLANSSTTVQATARPGPMDRPPVSYLEEVIPPCTPIEGSEEETCRYGSPLISIGQGQSGAQRSYNTEVISVSLNSSGEVDVELVGGVVGDTFYEINELNPTISQIVAGESRVVSYPQLVIRGTTRPHTTRCEKYPGSIVVDAKGLSYICFVDVRVNEYIIGRGPPDLTIAVYQESIRVEPRENWELLSNEWLDDKFLYPAIRTATVYEGREMIMLLTVPYLSSVETLRIEGIYFVVKPRGGPLSVSPLYAEGLNLSTLYHADILVDLVQQYRDAAENRPEPSDDRSSGRYLPPVLVDDANYLQDIYQRGAVEYEAAGLEVIDYRVLPPPPPSAVMQP